MVTRVAAGGKRNPKAAVEAVILYLRGTLRAD